MAKWETQYVLYTDDDQYRITVWQSPLDNLWWMSAEKLTTHDDDSFEKSCGDTADEARLSAEAWLREVIGGIT